MKISANQINLTNKVGLNSVYQKSTAIPIKPKHAMQDSFKKEEKVEEAGESEPIEAPEFEETVSEVSTESGEAD